MNDRSEGYPSSLDEDSHFDQSVIALLDGGITPADEAYLAEQIRLSEKKRAQFVQTCLQAQMLVDCLAAHGGGARRDDRDDLDARILTDVSILSAAEPSSDGSFPQAMRVDSAVSSLRASSKPKPWWQWRAIAALLVLVCGIAAAIALWPRSGPPTMVAHVNETNVVGTLGESIDAVWLGTLQADGAELVAGPMEIQSGLARLLLKKGVEVIVRGPSRFTLEPSGNVLLLEAGQLTALVKPEGTGFTVQTPRATIVDLGTEFGVNVEREGTTTAVVFEGHVSLSANGFDRQPKQNQLVASPHTVNAGNSVRVSNGQLISDPAPVAGGQFVRPADFTAQLEAVRKQVSFSSTGVPIDPSLVAFYDFEQRGSEMVVNQASGGSALQTRLTNPQWVEGRMPGKSALAVTSRNNLIPISISEPLDEVTFAMWVQIDRLGAINSLLQTSGHLRSAAIHWHLSNRDGKAEMGLWLGGTSKKDTVYSSPIASIPSQHWTYLAVTLSSAGDVRFYVDGQPAGAGSYPQTPKIILADALVGNWYPSAAYLMADADRPLLGRVDELAIYRRALNAPEIAKLFRASKP